MRKTAILALLTILVLAAVAAYAADAKAPQQFSGWISDDMCGLDHGDMAKKEGGEKGCTLKCIDMGSSFVLADREHKKVYKLDDQTKPKAWAGEKVVVTGTLDGDTIHVASIQAAK